MVAYGVGSPAFAIAEAMSGVFSARFDYPPEFIFLVSVVQTACAFFLLLRRFELLSVLALSVLSLGAVYSHFKIGSPLTSLPSVVFTLIQLMYGLRLYRHNRGGS